MTVTRHDDQEFVAGDDWSISGILLDINGNPLDLTNANLSWTFIDPTGYQVPGVISASTITVNDPPSAGMITIKVPAAATEPLSAGRYHDSLRVVISAKTTYWTGAILVDCDPFTLIPPAAFVQDSLTANDLASQPAQMDTPGIVP